MRNRRGPNYWELQVEVGSDPLTGRRRRITKTFRGTKRAAQKALAEFVAETTANNHLATDGTLGYLLDEWMAQITPTHSPTTTHTYRSFIESRIKPSIGNIRLDQLTARHLDAFYSKLRHEGLSPRTIRQYHAVIRRALSQAIKWSWIPANPADSASPPALKQSTTRELKVPTPEEVKILIAEAEAVEPEFATFLHLAAATGARRGELCALEWEHIDFKTKTLKISRSLAEVQGKLHLKDTKNHQERRISLSDKTVERLLFHRDQMTVRCSKVDADLGSCIFSDAFDCSTPWHPDAVTKRFVLTAKASGLEGVRLHDLRHYHATQLLGAGVDVQTVASRLGHQDPSVTLRVYSHFLPQMDRAAAKIIDGLF